MAKSPVPSTSPVDLRALSAAKRQERAAIIAKHTLTLIDGPFEYVIQPDTPPGIGWKLTRTQDGKRPHTTYQRLVGELSLPPRLLQLAIDQLGDIPSPLVCHTLNPATH